MDAYVACAVDAARRRRGKTSTFLILFKKYLFAPAIDKVLQWDLPTIRAIAVFREGLSEDDAYRTMQRESRHRRRSMREIAEAILLREDLKKLRT